MEPKVRGVGVGLGAEEPWGRGFSRWRDTGISLGSPRWVPVC